MTWANPRKHPTLEVTVLASSHQISLLGFGERGLTHCELEDFDRTDKIKFLNLINLVRR